MYSVPSVIGFWNTSVTVICIVFSVPFIRLSDVSVYIFARYVVVGVLFCISAPVSVTIASFPVRSNDWM